MYGEGAVIAVCVVLLGDVSVWQVFVKMWPISSLWLVSLLVFGVICLPQGNDYFRSPLGVTVIGVLLSYKEH